MCVKQKIDFVIPWVDGSDPKWIEDYNKFITKDKSIDVTNFKYRDWDNMQYWFRGVEKFTPWVNKIHFITWGHIPKWMNIDHPKINIVKHEDYIEKKYLPVFNVNPLEISLHKIKGLQEKFVYFNDDIFMLRPIPKERYFKNNLPCDTASETVFPSTGTSGAHMKSNVMYQINLHFSKRKVFLKNIEKWLSFNYNLNSKMKTLLLLAFAKYSFFYVPHMPNSYLKSTFEEVWEKNSLVLGETLSSKFRSSSDINQYLFKFWQLVSGNFHPINQNDVKNLTIFNSIKVLENDVFSKKNEDEISIINDNHLNYITNIIKEQKYSQICINDGYATDKEFNRAKLSLLDAFQSILPEKSSFEI